VLFHFTLLALRCLAPAVALLLTIKQDSKEEQQINNRVSASGKIAQPENTPACRLAYDMWLSRAAEKKTLKKDHGGLWPSPSRLLRLRSEQKRGIVQTWMLLLD
jgi:hypothetical protein